MLMAGALAEQAVLDKYGHIEENRRGLADLEYAYPSVSRGKDDGYTATQAVTMVTLAVGIWQIGMSLFRLGAFSVLLSDVLVSGFTTGSSVHVVTSQLKNVFGLQVPKENRFPKLLRVTADIFCIPRTPLSPLKYL